MSAFLYGVALQWKLDIRSTNLLVTCYIVPLLFFALMGGIFTSINPEMKSTLIQSMTVMGVSMGALIGLPTSLPLYFISLAVFIAVSLSVGCVLGLIVKNQAKLTMVSQIIFLPSIMLSALCFR